MFQGITLSSFSDPEFKEDSVRELIVVPILARLGFSPHGATRVVRSKTLSHPFIRVGTRQHPVKTVPDYTFFVDGRPALILDAKGPTQSVRDVGHVQQAYSYAIHPEVRCEEFALCNGLELAVYGGKTSEPLLELGFSEYESRWTDIEKFLGPRYLKQPKLRHFAPDFGTALQRMGIHVDATIHLPRTRLNFFFMTNIQFFTAIANCDFGAGEHCASFDFSLTFLDEMLASLPSPLREEFRSALMAYPFKASAGLALELDLTVKLGSETRGRDDSFVPLLVQSVEGSRFDPTPITADLGDLPVDIYNLRNRFAMIGDSESA